MPKRIQRKRCRGWRMPEGAVYVGRPGKWGNPFRVDKGWLEGPGVCINSTDRPGLLARAVELYRERFIHGELGRHTIREQLGGKDLACWCPLDQPCHADVLLEIANEETELDALRARIRGLRDSYLGNDGGYPDRHTLRADLNALLETPTP